MKNTHKLTLLALLTIATVLVINLITTNKSQSNTDTIIRVGAPLSLSGPASADGESIKNGILLAQKELAAKGIIIELDIQDDKTDPKETVALANYYVSKKVDAVIGPTWSYLADSAVPVFEKAGIATVQPANTSEYVSGYQGNTFFLNAKNSFLAEPFAQTFKEKNIKTIAILANDDAWGQTIADVVRSIAAKGDVTVVLDEKLPYGTESDAMTTISAKLLAMKPDMVVSTFSNERGVIALMKSLGRWEKPVTVLAVTTSFERPYHDKKFTLTDTIQLLAVDPETSTEFITKYTAEYGTVPGAYADTGYDALMLIAHGMTHKKPDQTLADYLHTTKYSGLVKDYSFDSNGDVLDGGWNIREIK